MIGNQDVGRKCKFYKRKDKKKIKRFNCNKKGHFARECSEPKKVCPSSFNSNLYISSCLFFTKSKPMWIVNLEQQTTQQMIVKHM